MWTLSQARNVLFLQKSPPSKQSPPFVPVLHYKPRTTGRRPPRQQQQTRQQSSDLPASQYQDADGDGRQLSDRIPFSVECPTLLQADQASWCQQAPPNQHQPESSDQASRYRGFPSAALWGR